MIDNPAANATEGSLNRAIKDIDEALGKGYAKQHPELIAGHMQACAMWNVGLELLRIREILPMLRELRIEPEN